MAQKNVDYPYLHPQGTIHYVSDDDAFMRAARDTAHTYALDRTMPTGTVLVKNGEIIGKGANGSTYHDQYGCERVRMNVPTGQHYGLCEGCSPMNHSEPKAVLNAQANGHETEGAIAYLWGHWWCCEPCWKALIDSGISKVHLLDQSEELFNKLSPNNIVGKQFAQNAS